MILVSEVFMSTAMHFRDHSMHKFLFPGVRGLLIILLIKATIPMVLLRVAYALFSSLALLKIIALVAPSILFTFFSIHSYHACIEKSLNHCDQPEVSFLKDFSKNPYTFTYFSHRTDLFLQKLIYLF